MPPQLSKLSDGSFVRKYFPTDYYLIARILNEIPGPRSDQRGEPTTGLRVEVVESITQRAQRGEQIDLFAYRIAGNACDGMFGASLNASQYPIGSLVRISTDDLYLPYWEIRYRILMFR
jgi:hypothetical protein